MSNSDEGSENGAKEASESSKSANLQCRFRDYSRWNLEIFASVAEFMSRFQVVPNFIRLNDETCYRVSVQMSAELVKEGRIDGFEQIGTFACPFGEINFTSDSDLMDDEYVLGVEEDEQLSADISELVRRSEKEEEDVFVYPGTGQA